MVATERALATIEKAGALAIQWEPDEIDVIKNVLCKGITDNELKLFAYQCQRTGLDPFTKQIHAIKRGSGDRATLTIQIGIDGLRLIAERTGRYCPGRAPTFVHDEQGNLISATAYVLKLAHGSWLEVAATAYYAEYVQAYDGKPTGLWGKMPHGQTAKCAESLALRKAFPNETSGRYSDHEMDQSDEPPADPGREPVIVQQESAADLCDAADYRAKYFGIAAGTNYAENIERANFIFEQSGGKTNSLRTFLATATPQQAAKLIGNLKARIDAERAVPADPETGELPISDEEVAAAARHAGLFGDAPAIEHDYDHDAAAEQRAEARKSAKAAPADTFDPATVKPWFTRQVKERGAAGAIIVQWDRARAIGDLLASVMQSLGTGIDITRFLIDNPQASFQSLTVAEADALEIAANRPGALEKLTAVHDLAVAWATAQKGAAKVEAGALG